MSPEQAQARRDEVTRRSDVYSLGAILYTLLTGQPPFRADSTIDTLMQVIHEEPVRPRALNAECPRGLEAISLKCLAKSPAARYATAHELAEDLGRYLQGERVQARPSRLHHRTWQWLRNVPLIAGVMGRKAVNPTVWHVRSQWIALLTVIAVIAGVAGWPKIVESWRLKTIDISTGPVTGKYYEVGHKFAVRLGKATNRRVEARATAGAVDGHDLLLSGDVDLAFLQENVSRAHGLKVLAPLYEEMILVLVRRDSGIEQISQLPGRHIALGPRGSGMRLSSEQLLDYFEVPKNQLQDRDRVYTDLADDADLEGAIVTIKVDALRDLTASGDFRLLPLEDIDRIHVFRVAELHPYELPGLDLPGTVSVPATFAILAVREQTPDSVVRECLNALYAHDGLAADAHDVFTKRDAAAWPSMDYHRAARLFFSAAREGP